jgi:hypothetical protein
MRLLTEDERKNFDQASLSRRTMNDRFGEIIQQVRNRLRHICDAYGPLYGEFSKYAKPHKTHRPDQICLQSLTHVINSKTQSMVFDIQERIDELLVLYMNRVMIWQICKSPAYERICRPLPAYTTMIR